MAEILRILCRFICKRVFPHSNKQLFGYCTDNRYISLSYLFVCFYERKSVGKDIGCRYPNRYRISRKYDCDKHIQRLSGK